MSDIVNPQPMDVFTGSPLTTKLAQVMAAVKRVPKRGKNTFHNYAYATEADVADVVREELSARGVMLYSAITNVDTRVDTGDSGKPSNFVTVTMRFEFVDGESGESRSFAWVGAGQDRGEKGLYKAITGAEKYFLLKSFLIPTGDDPEDDAKDAHPAESRARWSEQDKPKPTPAPAPPPLRMPPPAGGEPVLAEPDFGPDPDLLGDGGDSAYLLPNGVPAQKLRLGPSKNSPAISEAQAKRLFAIVRDQGLSAPDYRDWLLAVSGYSSDKDIPKAHYEPICIAAALIGKKETDAF